MNARRKRFFEQAAKLKARVLLLYNSTDRKTGERRHTQADIARKLSISREYVRQVIEKGTHGIPG